MAPEARLYRVADGRRLATAQGPEWCYAVLQAANGTVALGGIDGLVYLGKITSSESELHSVSPFPVAKGESAQRELRSAEASKAE